MKNSFYLLSMKWVIFLSFFFFLSCATKKDVYLFQDLSSFNEHQPYKHFVIKKGDILNLQFSSLNSDSMKPFILNSDSNETDKGDLISKKLKGYLVNNKGFIILPILGNLKVEGLTTVELETILIDKLTSFVKDPIVKVVIINFNISILGEVNMPGNYPYAYERVNIFQLLSAAGDLTVSADRKNVILLRSDIKGIQRINIDLTDGEIINSPYYYLNSNDIIYVPPNTSKVKTSGLINSLGSLTSIISFVLSLTILLFNR